jgi:2-oxoglutarate dehydrogenase E2 component (dihydrolipoamide succinyltransferase)
MSHRHDIRLPDLGLHNCQVVASMWLVEVGREVTQGDRLLEVLADCVTVDLPAPLSGILVETLVAEDEPLCVGQVLGVIQSDQPPAPSQLDGP